VRAVQDLLNNRPRACLDYRTPNEVFLDEPTPENCN
jgi:IS30 family transposase